MSGWPKKVTIFVHRDKESNYDLARELGFPEDSDAERMFAYTCYEVKLDLIVNESGEAFCSAINGRLLKEPVSV